VAITRNAACATGRGEDAGKLEPGDVAELVVMDTTDYRDLAYFFGGNPATGVMIGGAWTRYPSWG
jgi:imidazolonepropionase-like amidohydrolase